MQSHFIERNEGFKTHYLEWKPPGTSDKLPVICIHGNLSNARMYTWIGEELVSVKNESPRHVIAIDIRGCGESGMPEQGFTLQHMASDINAVMSHLGITEAHFIAYSRGVAYALQYALQHPERIQGLIIGDFPTHYTKIQEDWAHRMVNSYKEYDSWDHLYGTLALTEHLSREEFDDQKDIYYVEKEGLIHKNYSKEFPILLQLESDDVDLSSALDSINGNLLILKGNEPGSLLSEEQITVYQQYNPDVVRVQHAGHDVFEPRQQVKDAFFDFFKDII
ncbi:alpha/beta fold hydrolase [Paenibacillus glacialis]|uniref:AB hydrolase-1 domain-containing protein n=1 Tax=Paenibacillus glacialis TaxID=494026 RepID=A0A168K7A8_9BACL|nr:alpha/beta hydrolase [Paenibacillus glacialis]OAB41646.1 hypothetical protein PGLA_15310 [Paenibacillus glacialis]